MKKKNCLPGISTDGRLDPGEDGSDAYESSSDLLCLKAGGVVHVCCGTMNGICFILQGKTISEW